MRDASTMSTTPSLIDSLTERLAPVSRRRPGREMLILLGILALQFTGTMFLISDYAAAIFTHRMPMAAAKAAMFLALTAGFAFLAFRSLDPTSPKQKNLALAIGGIAMAFGAFMLDRNFGGGVLNILKPAFGPRCFISSISFALPMFITLTIFMRGAAPTKPKMTALFIGIASGSWGAFLYSLQCPFMNIGYVAVWYGGAIALSTIAAAVILPRFARW